MSRFHFSREFKRLSGRSPWQYLTDLRMERSSYLPIDSGHSIGEIARECGFQDTSYFCKVFRKSFNASPAEYRRIHNRA